ncbi:MAG: cell division protein FtsL [Acidobacteria bacterium]|nr:cell division protein FtsL [Acidobacteriota bacterium]
MARTTGAADALGFAVPKDVHNNPVREVDRARNREMWWSALFVSVLVGGLLLAVWQHYEWTQLGYALGALQQERAAEETANRQLRLELETLRAPQRIELLATTQLHLVAPTQTEAVVIERVRQAAQPARTLVAQR